MNQKSSLFGLYGLRAVFGSFGWRGVRADANRRSAQPVFGERVNPPHQSLSLQRARLSCLRSALHALFEDEALRERGPLFTLVERDAPQLLIGETAVVLIDGETGLFVFLEKTDCSGVIVVTASDERLIDHVICHLAGGPEATGTEAANKAARMLVGHTLVDVERRLIFHTLRHCHGNATRTAEMLDISLRTIRDKLREYWRGSEVPGRQS